jgi:transcriptional regulator with XRE-family HTH domain
MPPKKLTSLRELFAKNLRESRMAQSISQEALGDLAGVHRTFVSEVERGIRNLSIDNIEKLATALKIDPAELFRR